MKILTLKFWEFLKSIFLQVLLSYIAFVSWEKVDYFGNKTFRSVGFFDENGGRDYDYLKPIATDVDVASGFDGGALAMGLVCCVCIIMIVWTEINKKPKP